MINETVYKELLNRIIKNQQHTYGGLAINIFNSISGLEISADGKVTVMSREFIQILQDILDEFKKLDGDLSFQMIKSILGAHRYLYPDAELPVI